MAYIRHPDKVNGAQPRACASDRRERGALTFGVYSTDETVLTAAEATALEARVALFSNLTDGVYVNQSAAFSDFHGTSGNPAAGAVFTDGAFVSGRFTVVQSRRHLGGGS